jgi:hypothetical protein
MCTVFAKQRRLTYKSERQSLYIKMHQHLYIADEEQSLQMLAAKDPLSQRRRCPMSSATLSGTSVSPFAVLTLVGRRKRSDVKSFGRWSANVLGESPSRLCLGDELEAQNTILLSRGISKISTVEVTVMTHGKVHLRQGGRG